MTRAQRLRQSILQHSKLADVGHIGSALSVVEIVDVLVNDVLGGLGSADQDRDRLVLSKGHAALALFCALEAKGVIAQETLATYCGDDTLLGVHPDHSVAGIDFSTGSLGQGLSLGAGCALGAHLRGSPARTYVVISDAELNEGQTWEAVMFAGHHRLETLTAIVDNNHQQALAPTRQVLDLGDIGVKFDAFGWEVVEVAGHDEDALRAALRTPPTNRPRALLAETTCGKGVSFMEGRVEWHYLPMDDGQYRQALADVGA